MLDADPRASNQTDAHLSHRLTQLGALVAALAGAASTDEVAQAAVETTLSVTGATGAAIGLVDPGRDVLQVASAVGYPADFLEAWRTVELDQPLLLAEVVRTREVVILPQTDQLDLPPDVTAAGYRAFVAVPLLVGDRVLGTLAIGFAHPQPFPEEDQQFLAVIAGQCALALERTHLYEAEFAARQRLAFLAEASELLQGSLDISTTLDSLTRLLIPRLGDWCVVHLLREAGEIRSAALHHKDPKGRDALAAILEELPVSLDAPYGAGAVIATGDSQVFPIISDEVLVSFTRGKPALLECLRSFPLGSGIVVPLRSRNRTFGALTVGSEERGRYPGSERGLLEDLARRAGMAIDNALAHGEARDALAARDEAAAAAETQRAHLAAVLDQLPVGVILADAPSGRVALHNSTTDAIWGEPFGEYDDVTAYGRLRASRTDGSPLEAGDWPLARALAIEEVVRGERVELWWRDGRRTTLEISAAPIRDRTGRTVSAVAAFTDVTSRVKDERALRVTTAKVTELARTLQASLLPPTLPEIAGVELAAEYRPLGEGIEVGGDFYDAFPSGRQEEWALVVGDVCGKGAQAAAVTALARHTLRAAALRARRPAVILSVLNEVMLREPAERPFLTAVYLVLRPGRSDPAAGPEGVAVTLAVAGHPLPLLLRADGSVHEVGEPGSLVGVLEDPELTDVSVELQPGDTMVLYTDGVTEARAGSLLFGDARLRAALARCVGLRAGEISTALTDAVGRFQQGPPRDDLALLVLQATSDRVSERPAEPKSSAPAS